MKRLLIGSLVFALSTGWIANAKEKPVTKEQAQAAIDTVMPVAVKMAESMADLQLTILSKPETAEKLARYVKNLNEALIKEGFSKEETLKIVTSLPLPLPNMGK
jgi:1,2-phenylacetyl-CoA epoxidase catalytic subunit